MRLAQKSTASISLYSHVAILLLGICAGCTHDAANSRGKVQTCDWLEFTRGSGDERIILYSSGAAHVELTTWGSTSTAVIPVGPEDVQHILTIIAQINGKPEFASPLPKTNYSSALPPDVLRWEIGGERKEFTVASSVRQQNFAWDGICREIEFLAMVDLAKAVALQRDAEAKLRSGKESQSAIEWGVAFESLVRWGTARSRRYGVGIYEPEVQMLQTTANGRTIAVSANSDAIQSTPGITDAQRIELLRQAWKSNTTKIVLTPAGDSTIVSFKHEDPMFGITSTTIPATGCSTAP